MAVLASVLFVACDKNRIYEKNIAINKYVWSSEFTPSYTVEIKDTDVLYNLYLNIRHAEIYPYQNIWLLLTTQFPDSTSSSKRLEVVLANDEGKWFGEGMGDIWDYRVLIQENAFFTRPGFYTFKLTQNMRQDPLPGIMAVGIRIENTNILKKNNLSQSSR